MERDCQDTCHGGVVLRSSELRLVHKADEGRWHVTLKEGGRQRGHLTASPHTQSVMPTSHPFRKGSKDLKRFFAMVS